MDLSCARESGASVVGFDLGTDDRRLRLVGAGDVPVVRGDITDRAALDRVLDEHAITHVIHLAALLIPQIKANPPLGTAINVGGTVNVLDAAKSRGIRVAYASSAAVYSQVDDTAGRSPTTRSAIRRPSTACTNRPARDWRAFSGRKSRCLDRDPAVHRLRPGPGSGLTASPSLAMAAAARGEDSQIAFGGRTQLQFAPDTARVFVAAARAATEGARVFSLGGPAVARSPTAAQADREAANVTCTVDEDTRLPFPDAFDNGDLEDVIGPISWTPLAEGVRATIDRLRDV